MWIGWMGHTPWTAKIDRAPCANEYFTHQLEENSKSEEQLP